MRNLVFAMFCFVSLTGCCAVQHQWVCETSEVSEESITAYHGETVELQCRMTSYGKSVGSCGSAAEFLWQTNGMGNAWWKTNAVSRSGCVSFNWTPYQDCGADRYTFFFRVTDPKGDNYRANGTISLLGSPSGDVRYLPLPTKVIDFASVSVENPTNAPWMMKGAEIVTSKQVTNTAEFVAKEGVRTNWLCTVSVAQQKADAAKTYADGRFLDKQFGGKVNGTVFFYGVTQVDDFYAGADNDTPPSLRINSDCGVLVSSRFGSDYKWYYGDNTSLSDADELATIGDLPSLAGQSFNLSNQADFNRAVSNIVTILGGTVTGMP